MNRPTLLCLLLLAPLPAHAQLDVWAEGTDAVDDGATRDFYNRGAVLSWSQLMGDWRDRTGTLHGDAAWTTVRVDDTDTGRYEAWDVTAQVQAWLAGSSRNLGFFLRPAGGGGPIVFSSREGPAGQQPELVLETSAGTMTLAAAADTHLSRSTYQASGEAAELRVGSSNHLLVRFDLSGVPDASRATLRFFTTEQFGGGLDIGIFDVATGDDATPSVRAGIAADYVMDVGLADHADVVMVEDFEAADWMSNWTSHGGSFEVVEATDGAFGYVPLNGRALRALIPEGENTGLNTRYDFMAETGEEPEAIYFRYYLRLADDWNQSVDGGKLPGISGTYGVAGWGGRRSDGTNGWSARGLFHETIPATRNPLSGRTAIGSYVYHADMESTFGDTFFWTQAWGPDGRGGLIETGRWVCLETYVQMNTPGANDGVVRAWVDGVLSFEMTTLRFRDVARLRIERIWMNIYHGGTAASPYDQHAFIDHVVVARSYIGPMGGVVVPPRLDGGASPTDGGVPPGTDGGARADGGSLATDGGGSASADAGPGGSPGDPGCSCRATGGGGSSLPATLWLLGMALAVRRRTRGRATR